MTVTVTGATGFVGRRLVAALLVAGHRVVAPTHGGDLRRRICYDQRATSMMHRRSRWTPFAVLAICATAFPHPLAAMEIEGVRFADRVRAGAVTMDLNDVGLMRYRYIIKAYVAALYLGEGARPTEVLADAPKRLEIEYFYAIQAEGFVKATEQGIAANVSVETVGKLRSRIDRLNALYRDVKPGDRYALTYVPGVGTELALNGTPLGTVEGADFAAAVFAIWLGPNAIDASLKAQLLGRS